MRRALIVVDVQQGLDDVAYYGIRDNPACETNIARLIDQWREAGQPIVRVQHDSTEPESPLRPGLPGHELKPVAKGPVDLDVRKSVHSSFHGTPDLADWLDRHGIAHVAICGISTHMCCETTARVASDLGYDTWFVLDATHGHDLPTPDGSVITAAELSRATASVLAADFCRVLSTEEAVTETARDAAQLPPG